MADRLEEIKATFGEGFPKSALANDVAWLIAEVERLREALREFVAVDRRGYHADDHYVLLAKDAETLLAAAVSTEP